MTIVIERYKVEYKTGLFGNPERVTTGEPIRESVTRPTAAECMSAIEELRQNNDVAQYTAYEIVNVLD